MLIAGCRRWAIHRGVVSYLGERLAKWRVVVVGGFLECGLRARGSHEAVHCTPALGDSAGRVPLFNETRAIWEEE